MSIGMPTFLPAKAPLRPGVSNGIAEIPPQEWGLPALAGRFIELNGGTAATTLSICTRLITETQRMGAVAVWVGGSRGVFFPPDLAANGVDLPSLAVVRLADTRQIWAACDTLLRSGGFALLLADVQGEIGLSLSEQTRLSAVAQRHNTALVAITRAAREDYPRSSLVSLRAETEKRRTGHDCFACEVRVTKDKRRVPGWASEELYRGADGLC